MGQQLEERKNMKMNNEIVDEVLAMKYRDTKELITTEQTKIFDLGNCADLFSMADLVADNPERKYSMDLETVRRVFNSYLTFVTTTRLYFPEYYDGGIAPNIDEDAREALGGIIGLQEIGVKEVGAYYDYTMTLLVLTAAIIRKVKQLHIE